MELNIQNGDQNYNKNKKILEENNIKTNSEYRKFMTNNADSIIRLNGNIDKFCSSVQYINNILHLKHMYIQPMKNVTW